ncbi:MAG: CsgG/HfaB family protein [Cyanobacteriota bacterium]|nr:CsgG/HfaB family protein [Cyanobacteriota bacterium]
MSKYADLKNRTLLRSILGLGGLCLTLSALSGAAWAQSNQNKPTISVPDFKNETNWWWWNTNTSRQLADALSNELTSTGNFAVVERQKLGAVLSEQELAELGLVKPGTGAKKGELTGAQYIILGKVTSYEEGVESESGGQNFGLNLGIVNIGNSGRQEKKQAYVAIDLRVVDSTTGEVVYARTVEGKATDSSESAASDVGFLGGLVRTGNDNQKTTKAPVGKALRAGLIEITNYLSCVMVEQDACLKEFQAKEQKRRQNTQDVLQLE